MNEKEAMKRITVHIDEELVNEAFRVGEGNLSLGIRRLIKRGQTDSHNELADLKNAIKRLYEQSNENVVNSVVGDQPKFEPTSDQQIKTAEDVLELTIKLLKIHGPMERKQLVQKLMENRVGKPLFDEMVERYVGVFLNFGAGNIFSLIKGKTFNKDATISSNSPDNYESAIDKIISRGPVHLQNLADEMKERFGKDYSFWEGLIMHSDHYFVDDDEMVSRINS
jgi:hypothetical protein